MPLKSRKYISFLGALLVLLAITTPSAAKSIRLGYVFKHSVFCVHHHAPGFNVAALQKFSLSYVETEDENDEIEELAPEKSIYSLIRPVQPRENTLQEDKYTTARQYHRLRQQHLYNSVTSHTLPYYYTFLFRFTPF